MPEATESPSQTSSQPKRAFIRDMLNPANVPMRVVGAYSISNAQLGKTRSDKLRSHRFSSGVVGSGNQLRDRRQLVAGRAQTLGQGQRGGHGVGAVGYLSDTR